MSNNKQCPDIEELSAWVDNESSADFSEHCANCQDCQEIVDDFKKMDLTINSMLNNPANPETVKQISQTCENRKTVIKFRWIREIVKIAAILIAALLISRFYEKSPSPTTVTEVQTDKTTQPVIPVITTDDSNKEFKGGVTENSKMAGTIPAETFDKIGIQQSDANMVKEYLEDEITHTWISDDPQKTLTQLKLWASNIIIINEASVADKVTLEISMTDTQLLSLVNDMANQGNKLLSNMAPQPNENSHIATNGKVVKYNLKIVLKK